MLRNKRASSLSSDTVFDCCRDQTQNIQSLPDFNYPIRKARYARASIDAMDEGSVLHTHFFLEPLQVGVSVFQ